MITGGVQAPLRGLSGRVGRRNLNPLVESAREASYPPPYPEAWYVVGRSIDFADRPTFVQCAGNQWVVFRDAAGPVRVVDAYCPHLGANLADGKVHDDSVVSKHRAQWPRPMSAASEDVPGREQVEPGLRAVQLVRQKLVLP